MVASQVGGSNVVKTGEIGTFVYIKSDIFSEVDYVGSNLIVNALSKDLGGLNPIFQKDPTRPNVFQIVDFTKSAPALGEATINEKMYADVAGFLETVKKLGCPVVIILAINQCGRQDEIHAADSWLIVDSSDLSNIDFGTFGSLEGESVEKKDVTGTMPFLDAGRVFSILFGEVAANTINAEVLDLIYAGVSSCGTCSPFSNGCDLYALTAVNAGSPGLSSQLITYIKGVAQDYDIYTLGAKAGNRLVSVGERIVVVSEADGAHHVANKKTLTSWSRVATGYVAGASPRCITALDPRNVFIGASGGYIYKSTNVQTSVTVVADNSNTSEDANDIHGVGQTIVCVHNNNVIQFSWNKGRTFSSLVGPEVGQNLISVWVHSKYQWEIGTNSGKLWKTPDGGSTWTQQPLPNQGNITLVRRISYSPAFPDELGALVVETLGADLVLRTITGGREWSDDTRLIDGLPTNDRINAVAWCDSDTLAAGGLNGSDGVLAVGASPSA